MRCFFRSGFFAGVIFQLTWPLFAYGQSPTPVRDSQAIHLIQQSLQALGGATAYTPVQSILATGTIQPVAGSAIMAGTFRWRNAGRHFRDFRYQYVTAAGTKVLASGIRPAVQTENSHNYLLPKRMRLANLPYYLPGAVLTDELNNSHLSITALGIINLQGSSVTAIRIDSPQSDRLHSILSQTWYFNPVTSLPVAIRFRSPLPNVTPQYQHILLIFSGFIPQQNLLAPAQITVYEKNTAVSIDTIQSLQINPPASGHGFALPPRDAQ